MKTRHCFLVVLAGLLLLTTCRDKDLDMTVRNKTLYQNAVINEISAEDAWDVMVVCDDSSFVDLKYSAFLEEYLKVQLNGTALQIGFSHSLNLPSNTEMTAVVHTPAVHKLSFSDAVTAVVDGQFPETALTLELSGASLCRGGHFSGSADIKQSGVSNCVDFYFEGTTCTVNLDGASVLKCCLKVSDDLTLHIKDASRMTDYWGEINHVVAEVSAVSYLNMVTSWINRMNIEVSDASEATVNVVESLEGQVRHVSKLYYSGHPEVNVDCDETSFIEQVEYPNP